VLQTIRDLAELATALVVLRTALLMRKKQRK